MDSTRHIMRSLAVIAIAMSATAALAGIPTLTIGTVSVSAGSPASVNLTLANNGTSVIAALTTDITYNASVLAPTGVTTSASAKVAQGNVVSAGDYRITVYGGVNTMADGTVATVSFNTTAGQCATYTLGNLSGTPTASDASANPVAITGVAGAVTTTGCGGGCAYTSAPYGLGIGYSPSTITVGTPITFTGSAASATSYAWLLDGILDMGQAQQASYTFLASQVGNHTVKLTATNCFGSSSTQVTISVTSSCGYTSAPYGLGISYNPSTITAGTPITFTGSAFQATSYSWLLDGLLGMGQAQQVSYTFQQSQVGSHTVKLTATNCFGSSSLQVSINVTSSCAFTRAPGLAVSYSPTGPMPGFPEQQQPMVGQVVTFDPSASTNIDANTKWNWAFAGGTPATSTQEKPQVTFNSPLVTMVVMNATNCFGWSWFNGSGQIYADVRHVTADFSWGAASPTTGAVITFTAVTDFAHGDPDTFTWDFGDSTPAQTGRTTIHIYSCSGNYNVTLTASGHGQTSAPTVKPIGVAGKICGPSSLIVVDAADLSGLNGTFWQTDVRIFNPAPNPSVITMWLLPVGQDNSTAQFMGLTLDPKATWSIDNVIDWANKQLGKSYTKSALRVTYDNPDSMAPMIVSRTYTQAQGGGTYGEFCPGIKVIPDTTPPTLWVTGVRNNGLVTGFRTNYSLVNLRGDPGGINNVKISLLDPVGTVQASTLLGIPPFGYFQGSIASLFGAQLANFGTFALRVDVPQGADLQFYASVVDNQTGASALIPAGVPGTTPIYLPAIGHNPGLNGSVWRSDLQLTNADTAQHTWEIKFSPSQSRLPAISQTVALGASSTWRQDDVVSWVYGSLQTPDTNGVVRIASADGSSVYPVVASSSYNLTPNGTFGQNNIPLTAAMGVSTTTPMQHLLLTAMSSADIARTNLGFIDLSESNGVNFSVMFYDENGNVLNPMDSRTGQPKPLTYALNVGGWLQSQLENFFAVLGTTLPPGNKAISADITVLAGGPGFAYATVIDNTTNDPMFIPAQLAP